MSGHRTGGGNAAQLSLSAETVETCRIRAMEKLGLKSRMDMVHAAKAAGWFRPQCPRIQVEVSHFARGFVSCCSENSFTPERPPGNLGLIPSYNQ